MSTYPPLPPPPAGVGASHAAAHPVGPADVDVELELGDGGYVGEGAEGGHSSFSFASPDGKAAAKDVRPRILGAREGLGKEGRDRRPKKPCSSEPLFCGPYRVGPFVLELYGPLQLVFLLCAMGAFVLVTVEAAREDTDYFRLFSTISLFMVCLYVSWLGKAIYVIKRFRAEVARFRQLNEQLETSLLDLELQTEGYKEQNAEHERLNGELLGLNGALQAEVRNLEEQNGKYEQQNQNYEMLNRKQVAINLDLKNNVEELANQVTCHEQQNARHEATIQELGDTVEDLRHVERQLTLLSDECNGSMAQARKLLERLERNLKLDTVNTVFLFFDRIDKNRSGKIDPAEISLFVDNLSFLWKHLPTFNRQAMKDSLVAQDGISLEQVHRLVDGMLLEEYEHDPASLTEALEKTFSRDLDASEPLPAAAHS